MNLENLLAQDSFIMVNRSLLLKLGPEAAILLGDLYTKRKYFRDRNQLDSGGGFFNINSDIEISTGLKRRGQEKGLSALKAAKIITVKNRGVPPKKHFYIDDELLMKFIAANQVKLYKSDNLKGTKATTRNAQNEQYINKNKDNKNKPNNIKTLFPEGKSKIEPGEKFRTKLGKDLFEKFSENWKELTGRALPKDGAMIRSFNKALEREGEKRIFQFLNGYGNSDWHVNFSREKKINKWNVQKHFNNAELFNNYIQEIGTSLEDEYNQKVNK